MEKKERIKKGAAVFLAVLFLFALWAALNQVMHREGGKARSADARLQKILEAKAVLLGRMDEAERSQDKQAYMRLLKDYVEKQNEYNEILSDPPVPLVSQQRMKGAGFSDAEKLEMLALEHGIAAAKVRDLKAQIEIMFRETSAAEAEAFEQFLKSR